MMTPRTVHRLRKLRLDEVSSVDKSAGIGTRVMLAKRDHQTEEVSVTEMFQKIAKDDSETVAKAAKMVWESIAKREQQRDPSLTWQQALNAATRTPEYSEMHRQEKALRFGPGY